MTLVLLILQIIIVAALVLTILLQKSGSDGLAGLASGGHGFMSGRASASFITKFTMFLAFVLMLNSLLLAKIYLKTEESAHNIINSIETLETPAESHVPMAE